MSEFKWYWELTEIHKKDESRLNMKLRGTLALLVIASAVYSQSEYFHIISFFILTSISSVLYTRICKCNVLGLEHQLDFLTSSSPHICTVYPYLKNFVIINEDN